MTPVTADASFETPGDCVGGRKFRSKRPKEVCGGSVIWVDNEDCTEFEDIKDQAKYGEPIANEIGRAWIEFQFQQFCVDRISAVLRVVRWSFMR